MQVVYDDDDDDDDDNDNDYNDEMMMIIMYTINNYSKQMEKLSRTGVKSGKFFILFIYFLFYNNIYAGNIYLAYC